VKGERSMYGIPGALTSQHKYTGQEHRVGGDQWTRTGTAPKMRLIGTTQKKQETNVQTKDVEEAIKTCDGIVGEEGGCV